MMIYEALKQDHAEVKQLLTKLLAMDEKSDPSALITEIRDALIPHSRAEEAVFYNSLRGFDRAKTKIMHSYTEHLGAETMLRTLQVSEKLPVGWKTLANKLKDSLDHHIQEEEGVIFPLAQQFFTEEEARMMTTPFEQIKEKTLNEGLMKTTLDLAANLMPARFMDSLKSYKAS